MPKIDNWYVTHLMGAGHLVGSISGHERQGEFHSDTQMTSYIVGKKDGKVVTRSGTHYELGKIDPGYEAEYPNAKERLLNSLDEIAS